MDDQHLTPASAPAKNRCLYCLREDRSFTSVEHVIPEALGNKDILLPAGVVCDKCNNGELSVLDLILADFDPIAMVRVQNVVPTKAGKWPKAQFGDAFMQRTSSSHVHIKADRSKSIIEVPGGFKFNFRGRRPLNARHRRELTRALFKIALGMVYLGDGPEVTFSKRFDPVRKMVRKVEPLHGYLLAGMQQDLEPQDRRKCVVRYFPISDGKNSTILVYLNFGGVVLATDLLSRDPDLFTKWPKDAPILRF